MLYCDHPVTFEQFPSEKLSLSLTNFCFLFVCCHICCYVKLWVKGRGIAHCVLRCYDFKDTDTKKYEVGDNFYSCIIIINIMIEYACTLM